jgi:5-methylcytosine-specific restriction endonuclease McrA
VSFERVGDILPRVLERLHRESRRCAGCGGPNDRELLNARKCNACIASSGRRFRELNRRNLGSCSPLRRRVWERDGGRCVLCKVACRPRKMDRYDRSADLGEIDHIIPKSRGGRNTMANLRLLCKTCNRQKGAT